MAKEASIPAAPQFNDELIRHQLHLQTIQSVTDLYRAVASGTNITLIEKAEAALSHLLTPLLPAPQVSKLEL